LGRLVGVPDFLKSGRERGRFSILLFFNPDSRQRRDSVLGCQVWTFRFEISRAVSRPFPPISNQTLTPYTPRHRHRGRRASS